MFRLCIRSLTKIAKLENTSEKIVKQLSKLNILSKYKEEHLRNVVNMCLNAGLSSSIICDNYWLIEHESDKISGKIALVEKLNLRSWEEGVPFLKLSSQTLLRLTAKILSEKSEIPSENRLYYLSDTLKMDPATVASFISKRLFIYNIPFKDLRKNVEKLLEFNVKPERIMNDLWVLNYKTEVIEARLTEFINAGSDDLFPWMVKCPDNTFHRSIVIRNDTKTLMADSGSTFNYIAQRLNCSIEDVMNMATRNPPLRKTRITKARDMIDFLLRNGFSKQDIISAPVVFAHSIKKLDARLNELRSLGEESFQLTKLCKSKELYLQYVNYLKGLREMQPNDL